LGDGVTKDQLVTVHNCSVLGVFFRYGKS